MSNGRVLLTGAFGNVGANALERLHEQRYDIVAMDLPTVSNRNTARRLSRTLPFEVRWVDLCDEVAVRETVAAVEPEAIVHVAAVIPPIAFRRPANARAVNVQGARHLVDAALALPWPPKLVNVSSYTIHGHHNPHKDHPRIDADTPVHAIDNYGVHKVAAEQIVHDSGLPATTLRFAAVLATDPRWGTHPDFLRYGLLLPLDRRMHLVHSKDAALALVNAIAAPTEGRRFVIGGPSDCAVTARTFMNGLLDARGLGELPDTAFRRPDPAVDEAWHSEEHLDTTRSQAVLGYQEHSFADYLDLVKRQAGWTRTLARLLAPLIERRLLRSSPAAARRPGVDARDFWHVVCEEFAIDEAHRAL